MKIDHVHFFVEDAIASRDWFVQVLGFQFVARGSSSHSQTEVVRSGPITLLLSSAVTPDSPVAAFLRHYSPGVADVAWRVPALDPVLERAIAAQAKVTRPWTESRTSQGCLKLAQIQGWGSLRHTLIERQGATPLLPDWGLETGAIADPLEGDRALHSSTQAALFDHIDHTVLNVAPGDLDRALGWYERALGFARQQSFAIQTERSSLRSQVLVHPASGMRLPVNEPTSPNSQVQEFLNFHGGPGIQHIALATPNLIQTVATLRSRLAFLAVPPTYYQQLHQRYGQPLPAVDWRAIADQQILVDWQEDCPEALLLQTFTQPIFGRPTFFFELIERRVCQRNGQHYQVQGFGEGNFQALFEAIEREQMQRGSL